MKCAVRIVLVWLAMVSVAQAQTKMDEARMQRDIEVAENVLGTLLRQQIGKRTLFPLEVTGTYMPGYGITFRIPQDGPMAMSWSNDSKYSYNYSYVTPDAPVVVHTDVDGSVMVTPAPEDEAEIECDNCPKKVKVHKKGAYKKMANDSVMNAMNDKVIGAAKDFIADYSDLITQLGPDEKIMITNRSEGGNRPWFNSGRRKLISVEGNHGDVTQFKQGKLTRPQLMAKITVINSETSDTMEPDLELLSSIFNRLYRSDLSKTYYIQENLSYERLKDFGVIYYMQVYSSNENDSRRFNLPTVDLEDVDKETRDKKVTELYPAFEKDIKESMVDYGRTVKTLKDNEQLVFMVTMTKCANCKIPASLELSIKGSVLRDFNAGKITKEAAVSQISLKKGTPQ